MEINTGVLIGAAFICGIIGMLIGSMKGRPIGGFLWSALLGPIGWLLIFLLTMGAPAERKKRPASRPKGW